MADRRRSRTRRSGKDVDITPRQGIILGSTLIVGGALFWIVIASFSSSVPADSYSLNRLAFMFFVLPIIGAVLIVMSSVKAVRARGRSRTGDESE